MAVYALTSLTRGGAPYASENRVDLQNAWLKYRAIATEATAARKLLLRDLAYTFPAAPLWWRHRLNVMVGLEDATDTQCLLPSSYRRFAEAELSGSYHTSQDLDGEFVMGEQLRIDVPKSPNAKCRLSLVVDGSTVKWSIELQTRQQRASEWLSGTWWHTAELIVRENEVAVFQGCDDSIAAALVSISDGQVLSVVRFSVGD